MAKTPGKFWDILEQISEWNMIKRKVRHNKTVRDLEEGPRPSPRQKVFLLLKKKKRRQKRKVNENEKMYKKR